MVDKNNPEMLKALEDLSLLTGKYDLECIYNINKIGSLFWIVSRYIVLMSHEDLIIVRGKQWTKNKMTLVVSCNASETKWILITMIEKVKQFARIVKNTLSISYFHQKNVWIDVPRFKKWFKEVFEPYVCRQTQNVVASHKRSWSC